MGNNGGSTGCSHDLATGKLVLSHEMYGQLSPIYDAFVVDVCTGQIWLWRYPGLSI
jgi:hypothetical protein